VRVGFVGFPSSSKGWEMFSALVDDFHTDTRYEFTHFAARDARRMAECKFVVTETTPGDRNATIRMLRDHHIDFLAMLSPWPETFSFVAHEDLIEVRSFFDGSDAQAAAVKARAHPRHHRVINGGTSATVRRFFVPMVER
jgi:hypothetical protein